MYAYGDQTNKTSSQTPIVQIQLNHTNDKLTVTQTIKNLEEGTYPVIIPSNANKVQCENEEGKPCLLQNQEVTVSDNNQLKWQYQLDYKMNTLVYSDWYIKLQHNNQTLQNKMSVEVIEEGKPSLQWMAPGELQADIQKDYIHYYRWRTEQTKSFPLLRMSQDSYELYGEEGLYIYAKDPLGNNFKELLNAWKDSPYEGPYIIVINQDLEEKIGERYMIISELEEEEIRKYWLSHSLQSKYNDENSWLISVLTHYFYDTPIQDTKSKMMIEALSYQLSSSQKQQFLQEVHKAEGNQLTEEIDQALQRVVGKPTAFFKLNKNQADSFVPLYFMENKTLKVDGEKVDISWQPIIHQQDRYYPLAGIASLFQYELVALPSESLYIMRKDGESWRFSLNEKTFVHNEENFGVGSDVLKKVQGEVFIKEKYVEELLEISVNEGSYSINMKY